MAVSFRCVLFIVLSDFGLGFGVYPEMLIIAYLVSEAWLFLKLFVVSFMSVFGVSAFSKGLISSLLPNLFSKLECPKTNFDFSEAG